MEQKRFFWLRGILVFVGTTAILFALGAPLQVKFGMWGVLATELMILAIALLAALVMKLDIKEMLRIKAPTVGQIVGIVFMVLSGMVLAGSATYIIFLFYPDGIRVATTIWTLYHSIPGFVTWLIIAVSPAICEEVLHRGVILHTF